METQEKIQRYHQGIKQYKIPFILIVLAKTKRIILANVLENLILKKGKQMN